MLEIVAPVVQWANGGAYAACPSEWAGRKVKVTPEGTMRSFEAVAKSTASGGAYILMVKALLGNQVNIKLMPAQ